MNKKPQPFAPIFVLLTENDEKLMEYVQNGNSQAFEKLYEKYKLKVFNFIAKMLNDPKKAEDLTQEVFLKVFKNADKFSTDLKFTTWMFTIARNTSIDFLRKKSDLHFGLDNDESSNWVDNQIDPNQNIEMQAIYNADLEILKKCMNQLNKSQYEALNLRVFSELSYDEIAGILDKSLSSIKSLINRAKSSLDKCVKECMEQES